MGCHDGVTESEHCKMTIILASPYKRPNQGILFTSCKPTLDRFGAILTYFPATCPLSLAVSSGHLLMVHLLSWWPSPLPVSLLPISLYL